MSGKRNSDIVTVLVNSWDKPVIMPSLEAKFGLHFFFKINENFEALES